MVNGKTPIVRCEDKDKYQSIDALNRPEVRIVANPGGSNEKFARTMLPKASLTMHKDNLTIFDEVANGKADAFVTEAAEARVQSKLNPKLCAVNPDQPLQYAEMGYLIPDNDIRFKLYVDQWMHLLKASANTIKWPKNGFPPTPRSNRAASNCTERGSRAEGNPSHQHGPQHLTSCLARVAHWVPGPPDHD
ncbi:cyclohexadienyl dehydratase [Advenella kashmirensis WT001]|uniref:Cyclohexadienyl dehydratase n=1 Tax=Advenella kashmirensis (strain DSM 17095 / LMG 22695 / WT001) TaxID=1036672 RepID=I3U8N7_ADVKW